MDISSCVRLMVANIQLCVPCSFYIKCLMIKEFWRTDRNLIGKIMKGAISCNACNIMFTHEKSLVHYFYIHMLIVKSFD